MPHQLNTSTDFACAVAIGADWREIGRKLLESLESIRTPDDGMQIGFLYATDALGADVTSLISLLRNITRIQAWFGATGAGICGNGTSITGMPAAVAMIGRIPEGSFHAINLAPDFDGALDAESGAWLAAHPEATLGVIHGLLCSPSVRGLDLLREKTGIFSAGGFAGGRQGGLHIAGGSVVADGMLSGVLFDQPYNMLVGTAQGCIPAGPPLTITGCRDSLITSIDDQPAFNALRSAIEQIQLPPVVVQQSADAPPAPAPERRGHIHAAFPIRGLDTGALMVRNITQADEELKTLSVAHSVTRGDSIQFVYRDPYTALDGLAACFQDLRDRAIRMHPQGKFAPKALLHFGCGARLPDLGALEGGTANDEARLAARIFGNIPMAGFYTAAEICNGHVYGYTGVSVLIL